MNKKYADLMVRSLISEIKTNSDQQTVMKDLNNILASPAHAVETQILINVIALVMDSQRMVTTTDESADKSQRAPSSPALNQTV